MKTRKICPLATRIKKMMQTDDDVGKISQATPILIGRAMELFLEKLCRQAITVAQSRQAKTLTPSHLKAAVKADKTLDFLAELVAPAPDLPAVEVENGEAAPKPKRRRTNDHDGPISPQGRGGGRGGGSSATAGQTNDDTPPAPHSKGRGSKPPLPPGSQPSAGRGGGRGQSKEPGSGGGRGRKSKATAAATAAAASAGAAEVEAAPAVEAGTSGPGPSNAAEPPSTASLAPSPSVGNPALNGTANIAQAPQPAPSAVKAPPEPTVTPSPEPAVKPPPEPAPKHESPPSMKLDPASGAGGGSGAAGTGGSSIVASLRAQQPFFGLGRRGKNLGSKGSASAATPSQGQPPPARQRHVSPQPGADASTGLAAASSFVAGETQPQPPYPLKLEPLDLTVPHREPGAVATHDAAVLRLGEAGALNGRAAAGQCSYGQCSAGHGGVATTSPAFGAPRRDSSGGDVAGPGGGPTTSAIVCMSGQGGMGPPQSSLVGSCPGPAMVAGPLGNGGVGSLLGPLGASIAFFQAPQQQADMDDDYDDY